MPKRMDTVGFINHLRAWGLKVEETPGWRTRGRPYNFYPKGVLVHHDASSSSSGNYGARTVVTEGRVGLSGPLSQFLLARNGVVVVVAAGYANHAGYGGPRAGIPENQGNTYMFGIEAANNGLGEKWPKEQLNAYYRLCAALLDWIGTKDVNKVFGHKEWTSRKIDPAGIYMNRFRSEVAKALADGPNAKVVHLSRLKPGKRNKDVLILKQQMNKKGKFPYSKDRHGKNLPFNNYFNKKLENAFKDYQREMGRNERGVNGIPGPDALNRLGLVVKK